MLIFYAISMPWSVQMINLHMKKNMPVRVALQQERRYHTMARSVPGTVVYYVNTHTQQTSLPSTPW